MDYNEDKAVLILEILSWVENMQSKKKGLALNIRY